MNIEAINNREDHPPTSSALEKEHAFDSNPPSNSSFKIKLPLPAESLSDKQNPVSSLSKQDDDKLKKKKTKKKKPATNNNNTNAPGILSKVNINQLINPEKRRLELEAYAAIVSAFKAQGELTWRKESILVELRSLLKISEERHRQELRRVDDSVPSLSSSGRELKKRSFDEYDYSSGSGSSDYSSEDESHRSRKKHKIKEESTQQSSAYPLPNSDSQVATIKLPSKSKPKKDKSEKSDKEKKRGKKKSEKDANGNTAVSSVSTPMDVSNSNLGSINTDNSNDAHEVNTTPQLPPLQVNSQL
mmetsp:Transcript_19721/g.27503  ORF Transcript_19721/g.27503 Transcript_19721/m.27503 type:complete len:302 (-) Transcript_19721:1399-2304(-)